MQSVTILPGRDKTGKPGTLPGHHPGAGRTVYHRGQHRLREVPVHQGCRAAGPWGLGHPPPGAPGRRGDPAERRQSLSSQLVAHLGQNMRFVLDASVEEFLALHAQCRGKETPPVEVLALANEITPEPVALGQSLNQLSGGQSRALMIADIALLCDSPIVLIDEIENAGIDKERALGLLQRHDKLVLVVTHDPHTALMSRRRIVMGGGAVAAVVERSPQEAALYMELGELYRRQQTYQASLRRGDHLA